MKNLGQHLVRIFLNDGFLRALPLLTLLTGSTLFAAAYLIWPAATSPVPHDIAKSLAQTILVSGLVSVLTNSLKYIGIFRDAIHEVFFSQAHLQSRSDLPQLWSRITSAICHEKFPRLSDHLRDDVLNRYLPGKKDFYYSDYTRECTITLIDPANHIVSVYEEIDFVLNAQSTTTKASYTYKAKVDSRTSAVAADFAVHSLTVDGKTVPVQMASKPYDDEFEGQGVIQTYTVPLVGQERYRIRRASTRRMCISKDPIIEYSSHQFILGSTVKIRSESPEIAPVFQSVGTEEFDDRTIRPAGPWRVHREFPGLLYPEQGYIMFIQRQLS